MNNKTLRETIHGPLRDSEENLTVSQVVDEVGQWKWDNFSTQIPEYLKQLIGSMYLPFSKLNDKVSWGLSSNGLLTTKNVYQYLQQNNGDPKVVPNTYNWIWALRCTNKIKHVLWICQHKRLPTHRYLNRIGINISPLCHICNESKMITHIFLQCQSVKNLWQQLGISNSVMSILKKDERWLQNLFK